MNKIRYMTLMLAFVLFSIGDLAAQNNSGNRIINSASAGRVRLGMTVGDVRKAVSPFTIRRTSDGEGIALIAVENGSKIVMTLFAGEENADAAINEKAVIEQIEVWDASFRTVDGVHAGMLVTDVEKIHGKVKEIVTSEIESRRYVTFTDHPKGIVFRVESGDTSESLKVVSILLNVRTGFAGPGNSAKAIEFTSSYSDLKKGCRSIGGKQGGHVSTFCKGLGNYQIHYFDSATTLEILVETLDGKDSFPIASQALSYLTVTRKLEWRMANGKPFAVILRTNKYETRDGLIAYPARKTGEFLVIKGLKGFEHIDLEIDAKTANANQKARDLADESYSRKTR